MLWRELRAGQPKSAELYKQSLREYNTGDPSRRDGTCEDPLHANRVERCEEHVLDQIHSHVSKNMLELISSLVKAHNAPHARISRRCSNQLR